MIIDAMDLLYSDKFDAFALISSDSDFTKLASRLKESQIYVFGVGEQKTPLAFKNACDDFISIEVLKAFENSNTHEQHATPALAKDEPVIRTRQQLRADTHLVNILRNAVAEYADDDGWAALALCGGLIKRQHSDFDPRTYGYTTLSKLFAATELFDIDRRQSNSQVVHDIYVKDNRVR